MFVQATITFLAIAQRYQNGTSFHEILITQTPSNVTDPAASVIYYGNDPGRITIVTSIDAKFFRGIPLGETTAKLQGFALVKSDSGDTRSDVNFHVDLNLVSVPSSKPSLIPSKSVPPSHLPSSSPSSLLNGLSRHVEVWGECVVEIVLLSRFSQTKANPFS